MRTEWQFYLIVFLPLLPLRHPPHSSCVKAMTMTTLTTESSRYLINISSTHLVYMQTRIYHAIPDTQNVHQMMGCSRTACSKILWDTFWTTARDDNDESSSSTSHDQTISVCTDTHTHIRHSKIGVVPICTMFICCVQTKNVQLFYYYFPSNRFSVVSIRAPTLCCCWCWCWARSMMCHRIRPIPHSHRLLSSLFLFLMKIDGLFIWFLFHFSSSDPRTLRVRVWINVQFVWFG